ncbi:aldo/keto reductase [Actinomadura kijaniata]|uniref:Aryl-alcohol dehydrogenase-like predicted oxidoreductase n=1 Tax=Actinomadura namibiensis TaxID=182080 RepID=A0A7W3LMP9_ACTNM|nr:aldo/keto reductase [Actinomadura namibiensis]MBA8950975.1 aryl-alcohol dehydrogenase-like predicted oxidoreductase [Actinomadura namibiensis]
MRYRLLGNTGLRVSEVFLGAMTFGERTGRVGLDEARRIVGLYEDAGGNVIDTADMYGAGESEEVVGEVVAGRRDRFVLATKYTCTRDRTDLNAGGNHRKNLTRALEESLRRLNTDYIDLYWAHVWDPFTPVEEMMRALDDAVRAGKVLYVGISDAPAWVVARANALAEWHGWTPFAGLQVPYNLLHRDIERELLPMAEALGLTVASWRPLAHGALAGRPRRDLDDRESAVVETLAKVAAELEVTPAQAAIAWVRARSRAVCPILGASRADQLRETLGAVEVTLPKEAVDRLTAAAALDPGFPHDFIAPHPGIHGDAVDRLDVR